MEEIALRSSDISKSFANKNIISDVSLSLNKGVHVFTGDNGCGKTTLLKMLMGLVLPDNGEVFILGENTKIFSKKIRSRINFATASDRSLYYKLTATENLRYIGNIYGVPKKILDERITELLKMLGLTEEGKYIETFSTGMKKRLMLAKSLINDPDILYYDEIFSGLDADGCEMALDLIDNLRSMGKLVLLVTHQKDMIPQNSVVYKLEDGMLNVLDS